MTNNNIVNGVQLGCQINKINIQIINCLYSISSGTEVGAHHLHLDGRRINNIIMVFIIMQTVAEVPLYSSLPSSTFHFHLLSFPVTPGPWVIAPAYRTAVCKSALLVMASVSLLSIKQVADVLFLLPLWSPLRHILTPVLQYLAVGSAVPMLLLLDGAGVRAVVRARAVSVSFPAFAMTSYSHAI